MNCPNCNRELAEGEICVCTKTDATPIENEQPAQPVGAYYIPNPNPQAQQTYYQPPQQPEYNGYQPPQQQGYYNPYQQQPQPQYYAPEPKKPASTEYPEGYKIKKKYVTVLLGFFLGAFGIHNFYLGYSSKAIAQLLLSTVGAIFVIGPVVSLIWSLVETVLILTENMDADAENYKIMTFEESLARTLK